MGINNGDFKINTDFSNFGNHFTPNSITSLNIGIPSFNKANETMKAASSTETFDCNVDTIEDKEDVGVAKKIKEYFSAVYQKITNKEEYKIDQLECNEEIKEELKKQNEIIENINDQIEEIEGEIKAQQNIINSSQQATLSVNDPNYSIAGSGYSYNDVKKATDTLSALHEQLASLKQYKMTVCSYYYQNYHLAELAPYDTLQTIDAYKNYTLNEQTETEVKELIGKDFNYLTDEQYKTLNYLYQTEGKKGAKEYYKLLESDLNNAKGMEEAYDMLAKLTVNIDEEYINSVSSEYGIDVSYLKDLTFTDLMDTQKFMENLKQKYPNLTDEELSGLISSMQENASVDDLSLETVANYLGVSVKGLGDGIDTFFSGLVNCFDDGRTMSQNEYASQYILTALASVDTHLDDAYQISTSIGNMIVPSAVAVAATVTTNGLGAGASAEMVGSLASKILFFSSTFGNAKHEKLVAGSDKKTALQSAFLSATSEVCLESVLGTIPGLGNSNAPLKNLINFNKLGKFGKPLNALKDFIADGISEGIEEGIQEYISTGVESYLYGTEINWDELNENAKKSFIYGCITSYVMNGTQRSIALTIDGAKKVIPVSRLQEVIQEDGSIDYGKLDSMVKEENNNLNNDIEVSTFDSIDNSVIYDLKSEISSHVSNNMDNVTKARSLYLELNKRVSYSEEYFNGNKETKQEYINKKLSFATLEENKVVCKGWSELYQELLLENGFSKDQVQIVSAEGHYWVEIAIGNGDIIIADATEQIGGEMDLANCKIGNKTTGFLYSDSSYSGSRLSGLEAIASVTKEQWNNIDSNLGYSANGNYTSDLLTKAQNEFSKSKLFSKLFKKTDSYTKAKEDIIKFVTPEKMKDMNGIDAVYYFKTLKNNLLGPLEGQGQRTASGHYTDKNGNEVATLALMYSPTQATVLVYSEANGLQTFNSIPEAYQYGEYLRGKTDVNPVAVNNVNSAQSDIDAASSSNPAYQNPAYQNPAYQNPAYQNPAYQNPINQNPINQNPAYQNPINQNPINRNPVNQNKVNSNINSSKITKNYVATNVYNDVNNAINSFCDAHKTTKEVAVNQIKTYLETGNTDLIPSVYRSVISNYSKSDVRQVLNIILSSENNVNMFSFNNLLYAINAAMDKHPEYTVNGAINQIQEYLNTNNINYVTYAARNTLSEAVSKVNKSAFQDSLDVIKTMNKDGLLDVSNITNNSDITISGKGLIKTLSSKFSVNSSEKVVQLAVKFMENSIKSGNKDIIKFMKKLDDIKTQNPELSFKVNSKKSCWSSSKVTLFMTVKHAMYSFGTFAHEAGHLLFDIVCGGKVPENWDSNVENAKKYAENNGGLKNFRSVYDTINRDATREAQMAYDKSLQESGLTKENRKALLINTYNNLFSKYSDNELRAELKKTYGFSDKQIESLLSNGKDASKLADQTIRNDIADFKDKIFRTKYLKYVQTADIIDAVYSGATQDKHGGYGHGSKYYKNGSSNFPLHEIMANYTSLKLNDPQAIIGLKSIFGDEFINEIDKIYQEMIS